MISIFEKLERSGMVIRGKAQVNLLAKTPLFDLIDIFEDISNETATLDKDIQSTLHKHCASPNLSGFPEECSTLECRIRKVNELAQFATIYGDKVVIENYLAAYTPTYGSAPDDSPYIRNTVINDIKLLLKLRPLIEAGIIVLFSPDFKYCPYCSAESVFGPEAGKRFMQAERKLSRDLFDNMSVDLSEDEGDYYAHLFFPPGLFDHPRSYYPLESLPKALVEDSRIINRLSAGESVRLSREQRRALGMHKLYTSFVMRSLHSQLTIADIVGTSILTDREVDLKILSFITNDEEIDRRNAIAARCLKTIMPFIGDVPINKLLELRKREEDAFIQFRSALDLVLNEMISKSNSFTEHHADLLYSDIILPELARLNLKVKDAKRDLIRASITSVAITGAAIAFGLCSGMLSPVLRDIASAIGLPTLISTGAKTLDLADIEKPIRTEKFYFLWKVQHLAKK